MIFPPRGFTLIEIAVVLALIAVLMALVIVRFDLASSRQALIADARRTGNLLQTYRERAMVEERTFALVFNRAEGTVSVHAPPERRAAALAQAPALKTLRLSSGNRFAGILFDGASQDSQSAIIYLERRGILGGIEIRLQSAEGAGLILRPDPLANEVRYSDP